MWNYIIPFVDIFNLSLFLSFTAYPFSQHFTRIIKTIEWRCFSDFGWLFVCFSVKCSFSLFVRSRKAWIETQPQMLIFGLKNSTWSFLGIYFLALECIGSWMIFQGVAWNCALLRILSWEVKGLFKQTFYQSMMRAVLTICTTQQLVRLHHSFFDF